MRRIFPALLALALTFGIAARAQEQSGTLLTDVTIGHIADGAPMTSKCTAQLLADLGVTRSLSRPQVCDDNPFSEAPFKTLKYHPGFPGRFAGIEPATAFCRTFFAWHNTEHRHGGISMLTPHNVHHGRATIMIEQRPRVLRNAWTTHPERFVRGQPKTSPLPEAVWINPPSSTTGDIQFPLGLNHCTNITATWA